jgi:hypothetical protein
VDVTDPLIVPVLVSVSAPPALIAFAPPPSVAPAAFDRVRVPLALTVVAEPLDRICPVLAAAD